MTEEAMVIAKCSFRRNLTDTQTCTK
jgi:hypothetical protein